MIPIKQKDTDKKTEWLKQRRLGIGGSDCAAVLGISRWKTPYNVWQEKITTEIVEQQKESEAMYFGKKLEPLILDEYSKRTGNKCKHNIDNTIYRSEKYPWLLATIDALVENKPLIVEAKTTRLFNEQWGDVGTDNIPTEYLVQCAHYCLVVSEFKNVEGVDIAALGATHDFRIYHYARNIQLEESIINITHSFWYNYVLQGERPPLTSDDDARNIYQKATQDTTIIATPKISELCEQLVSLKQNLKIHGDHIKNIENEIQLFMAEKEVLIDMTGYKLASWKNQGRQIFNGSELKKENLELYKKYTKTICPRVFRVHKGEATKNTE